MATDQPTVSVCITTYQHVAFIRQCLESVLSQDFCGTLEALVGDDGSLDGTRALIDSIGLRDSRIRAFHHERNVGPSANLQFLVSQARGRFIAHLDGDDYWLPGKLAAQLKVLQKDAGVVAVYCNAQVVSEAGRNLGVFNGELPTRLSSHELLRRGNFLNHSTVLYPASVRDAVAGIKGPFIDYRVHLRFLQHGAIAYVNTIYAGHRWRTIGSMIRTMPKAVCEGHIDAFHEAIAAGVDRADADAAVGRFWGKVLVQALITRRFAEVRYWGMRIINDSALQFSVRQLVAASLLAVPRAFASWVRRCGSSRSVFFP